MGEQIAIVGAGISGLIACKYCLSKGFKPLVFESQSCIGGAWTKTFETTKLQTPKSLYQFSDFPWPSSLTEEFPEQHHVLDYVQSYAHHFDLVKHIKFDSKVVSIEFEGSSDEEMQSWSLWNGNGLPFSPQGKWKVMAYQVDFVILCVGRFSDVPNIPEFPPNKGPEAFHGEVIHSMDYAAMDYESAAKFVKGKQVTVVGFQKSALDIAMECSAGQWFSELLLHKPGEGILLSLLATLLSPLGLTYIACNYRDGEYQNLWKVISRKKHPLAKYGMIPKHSFLQEISSCLASTVPEKFYEKVEEGSIILKKFQSFSFCEEGILINGETAPQKTDLVILATGFRGDKKLKDIFVSQTFQDCIGGSPDGTLPLYREIIHPQIPQLAVIGFSEGLSNLYTSEMRCWWLVELLDGTFKLPAIKDMEKDMAKWDEYMKRYSGQYYRRSCIAIIHIWYNDQLCKDMGLEPQEKERNCLLNCLNLMDLWITFAVVN
ncbi:hypothetical protein Pint_34116 [Pistacia integerrima]|uniref:Uncharacterized protein n=1 Tax=Pistacia integerrima TaxID=434235 RepID=A0ACC0X5W4_9ROSI|nr:hypothetical protein Pint_34116 [Pistacia integerrima]